jgi:hypothetical protein
VSDDFYAPVEESLQGLRKLLTQQGLHFVDLSGIALAQGVAMAWSGGGFLTLSIGPGSPHTVLITAGVLKDVERDHLAVLEACNYRNQTNPAYCFFLHDAEVGWDVLLQHSFPLQLLVDVPLFLEANLEPTTVIAAEARLEFGEKGVGGTAYAWSEEDAERLLVRSII